MASKAYYEWKAAGSPYYRAKPTLQARDVIRSHGYTVYDYPNEQHQQAAVPQDHTAYSATGWPVASRRWYGHAIDVMPGGPVPLPQLARQIIADRNAGVPGAGWIKYMNWTDEDGNCWQDRWMPNHERRTSTDKGHIHLSGRSDRDDSNEVASSGWDPVARALGEDDDMTPGQQWVQHVMNYRLDAMVHLRVVVVVPGRVFDGQTFQGYTEQCELSVAILKQGATSEQIEAMTRETLQKVSDDPDVPQVVIPPEQMDQIVADVVAGVVVQLDIPTAQENAQATVAEIAS